MGGQRHWLRSIAQRLPRRRLFIAAAIRMEGRAAAPAGISSAICLDRAGVRGRRVGGPHRVNACLVAQTGLMRPYAAGGAGGTGGGALALSVFLPTAFSLK